GCPFDRKLVVHKNWRCWRTIVLSSSPGYGRHNFGKTAQDDFVIRAELLWLRGEDLDQSNHCGILSNWNCNDGTDSQRTATLAVNARVALRVLAAEQCGCANARAGKTFPNSKLCSHRRSACAGRRAADDDFTLGESESSAACARESLRTFHNQLQGGIEI